MEKRTNTHTRKIRQFIIELIDTNKEAVMNDFNQLEGKDRVKAFTDLCRFVLPRLNSIDVSQMQELEPVADLSKLSQEELKTMLKLVEKCN